MYNLCMKAHATDYELRNIGGRVMSIISVWHVLKLGKTIGIFVLLPSGTQMWKIATNISNCLFFIMQFCDVKSLIGDDESIFLLEWHLNLVVVGAVAISTINKEENRHWHIQIRHAPSLSGLGIYSVFAWIAPKKDTNDTERFDVAHWLSYTQVQMFREHSCDNNNDNDDDEI